MGAAETRGACGTSARTTFAGEKEGNEHFLEECDPAFALVGYNEIGVWFVCAWEKHWGAFGVGAADAR